jgi:hypothetical protein
VRYREGEILEVVQTRASDYDLSGCGLRTQCVWEIPVYYCAACR